MFRKVWPAHAISKIIFILGSNKFVACLEHIRSYAWSFGHSDPDPSSVQAHHQAVRFSPTQGLVPTEFENVPPGLTRRGRRRRWILAHFSGFIWRPFFTYVQRSSRYLLGYSGTCHTVGQIPPKCKETSNLMWLTLIWFILVLFVFWNLFWTIANLRIKCVTETKNVSVSFYKNLKSSFSTWLTHLTQRFLYVLGCYGPRCGGSSPVWPPDLRLTFQQLIPAKTSNLARSLLVWCYNLSRNGFVFKCSLLLLGGFAFWWPQNSWKKK